LKSSHPLLTTFLFFTILRCSRLIYFAWHSPGIKHFSKVSETKLWLLNVRDLWSTFSWSTFVSRPAEPVDVGDTCTSTNLCTCTGICLHLPVNCEFMQRPLNTIQHHRDCVGLLSLFETFFPSDKKHGSQRTIHTQRTITYSAKKNIHMFSKLHRLV
jgi:hypothetical protein